MVFDLIVIGGGAAGFYGAIQAAEIHAGIKVLIIEKSQKLLSKVRVSGGGRCNVTHHCFDPIQLARHYPRGNKQLRTVFKNYHVAETVAWFASRKVQLKTEEDGRMFPLTDQSQTIVDCFLKAANDLGIVIETGMEVTSIQPVGVFLEVGTSSRRFLARRVLVAIGGHAKSGAYDFIRQLGHTIAGPIPSLFTFNDADKRFSDLMGVSVPSAEIRITSTRYSQVGPVLITHWGLSGPAVIRLSAWAAEHLHTVNYEFTVLVSWIGPASEEQVRASLAKMKAGHPKQKICANPPFVLPQRLWERLCKLAEITEQGVWGEISNRSANRLLEYIIRCPFHIRGKTTFKEEFVTCGGVDLNEVDLTTMESKKCKGVFFAGEVLNIDGETGGFNFQAAWSTAYLAARNFSAPGLTQPG